MISAKEQMQWQERLANSAHQREVADLQAAGLNPVLSAGGSGAATPSGSIDSFSSSGVSSGKGYSRKPAKDPNSASAIIKQTGEQVSKAIEKVFDSLPSSAKQNNLMENEASSDDSNNGFLARLGHSIEDKNIDSSNMMAKALSVFGADKSFLNRSVPIVGKFGLKWRDVIGGYFKRGADVKDMYRWITHPERWHTPFYTTPEGESVYLDESRNRHFF